VACPWKNSSFAMEYQRKRYKMKTFIVGVILGYLLYKSRDVLREMRVVSKTAYDEVTKETQEQLATADTMKAAGYSNHEIADLMDIPESVVRLIVGGDVP
jgi:hypothetical protein